MKTISCWEGILGSDSVQKIILTSHTYLCRFEQVIETLMDRKTKTKTKQVPPIVKQGKCVYSSRTSASQPPCQHETAKAIKKKIKNMNE